MAKTHYCIGLQPRWYSPGFQNVKNHLQRIVFEQTKMSSGLNISDRIYTQSRIAISEKVSRHALQMNCRMENRPLHTGLSSHGNAHVLITILL
ncbi:hypothetical protein ACQKM1_20350 [Peribacillus frigoritolerans]|uniref:hypothetical protein n=1 Tax=Peribacillus frigoritolerans TaxID=450367 RepID=UPI003D0729B9